MTVLGVLLVFWSFVTKDEKDLRDLKDISIRPLDDDRPRTQYSMRGTQLLRRIRFRRGGGTGYNS